MSDALTATVTAYSPLEPWAIPSAIAFWIQFGWLPLLLVLLFVLFFICECVSRRPAFS
jgi:hypothetical protein